MNGAGRASEPDCAESRAAPRFGTYRWCDACSDRRAPRSRRANRRSLRRDGIGTGTAALALAGRCAVGADRRVVAKPTGPLAGAYGGRAVGTRIVRVRRRGCPRRGAHRAPPRPAAREQRAVSGRAPLFNGSRVSGAGPEARSCGRCRRTRVRSVGNPFGQRLGVGGGRRAGTRGRRSTGHGVARAAAATGCVRPVPAACTCRAFRGSSRFLSEGRGRWFLPPGR
jgi:hypothetical protein